MNISLYAQPEIVFCKKRELDKEAIVNLIEYNNLLFVEQGHKNIDKDKTMSQIENRFLDMAYNA